MYSKVLTCIQVIKKDLQTARSEESHFFIRQILKTNSWSI